MVMILFYCGVRGRRNISNFSRCLIAESIEHSPQFFLGGCETAAAGAEQFGTATGEGGQMVDVTLVALHHADDALKFLHTRCVGHSRNIGELHVLFFDSIKVIGDAAENVID